MCFCAETIQIIISFLNCRSIGVRIKAPTIKEVLHFNQPEAENLCEPKSNEAKESEIKRLTIHLYVLLQVLQSVSRDPLQSVCFL